MPTLMDRCRSFWYGLDHKLYIPGRFAVLRTLEGSTATVLQVREWKTGQQFALKLLDPTKLAAYRERFDKLNILTEGEIGRRFDHEHLAQTLETGTTHDGKPFLLLNWLDGATLSQLLRYPSNQFAGKRIKLIRQLALALREIHRQGYLHRDVCPENIMITPDRSQLTLFDFGLSIPQDPAYIAPSLRSLRADYMAPELARRQGQDPGVRLDVFAFGVTAYQICTEQFPWATDRQTTTVARAFRSITDIRKVVPNLNRKLARLVMSCLLSDPNDRPASMDKVLEQLSLIESELEEQPAAAAKPSEEVPA